VLGQLCADDVQAYPHCLATNAITTVQVMTLPTLATGVLVGLGHFPPGQYPRTFPPEKNANNVVKIEAGMIK